MKTVAALIEELKKFPPHALAYAYEGEVTGIIIVEQQTDGPRRELGYIPASEYDDGPAEIFSTSENITRESSGNPG